MSDDIKGRADELVKTMVKKKLEGDLMRSLPGYVCSIHEVELSEQGMSLNMSLFIPREGEGSE